MYCEQGNTILRLCKNLGIGVEKVKGGRKGKEGGHHVREEGGVSTDEVQHH